MGKALHPAGLASHTLGHRWVKYMVLATVLGLPMAAWAFVKPVRIVAPTWVGLTCPSATLCTDDPARIAEATALYDEAQDFVARNLAPMETPPRVVFCSADACFQAFGLGKRSAATLGTWGIVLSPRAWKDYYVRHEMIHHLQYEKLGTLQALLAPKWFMEGMGYALSGDPRPQLAEPLESYRTRFLAWYGKIGPGQLWDEASKL